MRKQEKRVIGAFTYELTMLGTSEGTTVLSRLMKAADATVVLDPEVCSAFARSTLILSEGKRVRLSDVFEEHFAGAYEELLEWVKASTEFNFGPFLRKLRAETGAAEAGETASRSSSPTA